MEPAFPRSNQNENQLSTAEAVVPRADAVRASNALNPSSRPQRASDSRMGLALSAGMRLPAQLFPLLILLAQPIASLAEDDASLAFTGLNSLPEVEFSQLSQT